MVAGRGPADHRSDGLVTWDETREGPLIGLLWCGVPVRHRGRQLPEASASTAWSPHPAGMDLQDAEHEGPETVPVPSRFVEGGERTRRGWDCRALREGC